MMDKTARFPSSEETVILVVHKTRKEIARGATDHYFDETF